MKQNSLEKFIKEMRQIWGPLNSEMISKSQNFLQELVQSSKSESWLEPLRNGSVDSMELYRDPDHGFILLAYTEKEGLYRIPHDHGEGWVIYAVQSGEMQMGTYGKTMDPSGEQIIIRRELYPVKEGQSRVYLPGDIHDTKCLSPLVLIFRFTSRDLKKEIQAGRMHRYVESK